MVCGDRGRGDSDGDGERDGEKDVDRWRLGSGVKRVDTNIFLLTMRRNRKTKSISFHLSFSSKIAAGDN